MAELAEHEWLKGEALQLVFDVLTSEGGQALVVGGAVRNALLGKAITDIDIATTEVPERVVALAEGHGLAVKPTGIDHGTVMVIAHHLPHPHVFEVTTLRVDVETYGRHAEVEFTTDWAADARRRDLTMNALYCDRSGHVVDPLGVIDDVRDRRVRFVGDPHDRIREDYLRILRFFRFHAQHGHGPLDEAGYSACVELQDGLGRLAHERVRAELFKALEADGRVNVTAAMCDSGILSRVLPEPLRVDVFARMAEIERHTGTRPEAIRVLLALCEDADPDVLQDGLRLSKSETARLRAFVNVAPVSPALRDLERKAIIYRSGPVSYGDAALVSWALSGAASDDRVWREVVALANEWTAPVFPVTGADLKDFGVAAGPEMGAILTALEDWWVASGFPDDKAEVLQRLKSVTG